MSKTITLGRGLPSARLLAGVVSPSPRTNNNHNNTTRTLSYLFFYPTKNPTTTRRLIHYRHHHRHRHPKTHLLFGHPLRLTPAYSSIVSQMDISGGGMSGYTGSTGFPGQNEGDPNVFALSASSVLKIKKGDITKWSVDGSSDAIVNPANERMLGGGGADGAIHRAAGPELREACYNVPEVRPGVRCPTGEARITPGFNLPSSHVIHTVGPIYDVDRDPEVSLRNAYRSSLTLAKRNNIKYIAFPAISCGVYRYPLEEAAIVAISTVKEFANDFREVHFVLFSDGIHDVWLKKANELLFG